MTPYCIAHRGASAEAPENTLRAFERALALGVDGIELDVQVTRDGVAVVFHDSALARLTGTPGRLAERTWPELRKLRVQGERIPTLAEVLGLTRRRTMLQIEIKKNMPVAPVVEVISRTASAGSIILASFETGLLRQAAALAPKIPRMLIADVPRRSSPQKMAVSLLQAMASVGASGISLCHRAIQSPVLVETIHRHGAQLWCWTVDDVRTMRRLRSYSVNAILSNDPAKLIRTLRG